MPQKSKFAPELASATALLILIFTHLPASARQVLAYIGAGCGDFAPTGIRTLPK
jgi:hypothetical protein